MKATGLDGHTLSMAADLLQGGGRWCNFKEHYLTVCEISCLKSGVCGGAHGQIETTYLTDCDSLSDNVTSICPHPPSPVVGIFDAS